MSDNRRSFLKNSTLAAAATLLSRPINTLAQVSKNVNTLQSSRHTVTIYHSMRLNGNVDDPGGINQFNTVLNRQSSGGLILDTGNFLGEEKDRAHHESVIAAMNSAGYHASIPTAQDLSNGETYLASLTATMSFSLLSCNYSFTNETLASFVKPWQIINFGRYKIGLTGIGPKINGINYQDPIKKANETAIYLKEHQNCDLVVCLSDLNYKDQAGNPDNFSIAEKSKYIDFIIGRNEQNQKAHTMVVKNSTGHDVLIGHSSPDNLMMGKMSFEFREKQKHTLKIKNLRTLNA
ncbi:hypothetical protein [Pedobacter cryoconitis]|uniref:5'-nucleotidase n=1 Tax=Pedobacter cryoconitis TaxID=188932 RepID=A0A7X0J6H8_9SPHI|nr:hypothetical protein [Pedobacter cryoconitis]MBB6502004.1 5'-nucleotidase [Pedobacter cryoconitis]